MTDWVGKTLSKVRIDNLVARGGMAEVYRGMHTTLNRPVAVKILHRYLEGQSDLQVRFEREAQVLAGLRHPHIVQVYDFDVIEGQPFIVMEYVPGVSLSLYLQSVHDQGRRLTLRQVGQLLAMLVSALDYAHKQGIIHRDIKPANILLTSKTTQIRAGGPLSQDTEAILTDFGLLRLAQSASQTSSGTVSGTPAYMSPEQARGEQVDYRSDLYSLGVTIYEMLAGKVPFEADTSMAVLLKHIQEPPPPIDGLPGSLQVVLDRLLAKNPAERYESAPELLFAFLDASNLTLADVSISQPFPDGKVSAHLEARATLPPTPPAGSTIPATQSRSISWLPVAVFVFALILTAISLLWPKREAEAVPTPAPTPELVAATQTAHAPQQGGEIPSTGEMDGMMAGDETSFGILRFYSVAGLLDEAILSTWDLSQPGADLQYEAWLVGDEIRRSLGVLPAPDAQGRTELSFIDEQGRNLLVRYGRFEISIEPNPDPNPNSSGKIVYSSGIPPLALEHLRHLFVGFSETPGGIGLLVGLESHVLLVNEHTQLMLDAYQADDLAGVRLHAEGIYNALVGSRAGSYGDLDNDGEITDPGDGFGLLLNGDQIGYLEGTISHTGYAMGMADASFNIVLHGEHVIHSVRNVEGWAVELADLLPQITVCEELDDETRALILQTLAISDRMKNGRDLDGNERIEPVPGEGGLLTALDHAIYMLDMSLFEGVHRLPQPEPALEGDGDELIPGYMP